MTSAQPVVRSHPGVTQRSINSGDIIPSGYAQWQSQCGKSSTRSGDHVGGQGGGGRGGVLFSDGSSGALACSVATAFPPMVPSNFLKLDVVPASLLQLRT